MCALLSGRPGRAGRPCPCRCGSSGRLHRWEQVWRDRDVADARVRLWRADDELAFDADDTTYGNMDVRNCPKMSQSVRRRKIPEVPSGLRVYARACVATRSSASTVLKISNPVSPQQENRLSPAQTQDQGRLSSRLRAMHVRSGSAPRDGHSVETEFVALDVLHHDARLVVVIGRQ